MDMPRRPCWLTKDAHSVACLASLTEWPDLPPMLETDAEIHVGVTLSRSFPGQPATLSLDLNNNRLQRANRSFYADGTVPCGHPGGWRIQAAF